MLPAALSLAMAFALAIMGFLLLNQRSSRKTAVLLIVATELYVVAWVSAWDVGPLPVIGEVTESLFFLALGIGILLRGRAALQGWREWGWAAEAVAILVGQQILGIVVTRPEYYGYDPDVFWPNLGLSLSIETSNMFMTANAIGYVVLGLTFAYVLFAQRRRMHGIDLRLSYPLVLLCGLFAVAAAAIQYPMMHSGVSLDTVMATRSAQGAAAIAVPLAFFGSALRARWEERTIATRLMPAIGRATAESVQAALADVLEDPALRISIWLPKFRHFVDVEGQIRRPDDVRSGAIREIRGDDGKPLARYEVSDRLANHQNLLDAALDSCIPAFHSVQLQLEGMEQLRAQQARLLEAERTGRETLARNLHDGVQQDLAALHINLNRLLRALPDDPLREQAHECSDQVLDVIQEIRAITRGLHPTALVERGLVGALEADAERTGQHILLQVPPERLEPHLELALYYVLTEALTNSRKHSTAEKVRLTVRVTSDSVIGEVQDNGIGGAVVTLGGGLHGAADRVNALRGQLEVGPAPEGGTLVRAVLPRSVTNLGTRDN